MRLPRRMYWLADGIVEIVLNICSVSQQVRYCPYVTCVCIVEGCGLLADGQTCSQLTTRGYAAAARTL